MAYIGSQPLNSAFPLDTFTGDGTTVAYTMTFAPASTNSMIVSIDGVKQAITTYGISGYTLTFSEAPPSSSTIEILFLGIPASGVTNTAYKTETEFTATSGQTTFTVPSYTPGFVNVFQNGIKLGSADFTASNGVTVVLALGATTGDLVEVESFFVSSLNNAVSQNGGSFSGNVQFPKGTAAAPSIFFNEATTSGFYSNVNTLGISTNGNSAIFIDTIQEVGIGTVTPTSKLTVVDNSSNAAVRITQTGAGAALVVEDAANPDSTPFVIDASGTLLAGFTTAPAGSHKAYISGSTFATSTHRVGDSSDGSTSGMLVNLSNSTKSVSISADPDNVGTNSILRFDVDGTERARINSDGGLGVGASSTSTTKIRGTSNLSDIASTYNILYGDGTHTLTADNAVSFNAVGSLANLDQNGFNATISLASGGNVKGFSSRAYVVGASGTVTSAVGNYSDVRNTGAGTLTNAVGFQASFVNSGGGTLTNIYGVYVGATTAGTNAYGIHSNIASGTGRYNFYAAGTADNYFAGNVGIGTTTPIGIGAGYKNLVVSGGAGGNLDLSDSSGTVRGTISTDNSGGNALFIDTRTSHPIVFRTTSGSTERMRITSAGDVGIGISSPSYKLDVNGTGRFSGLTDFSNAINLTSSTLNYIYFNDALTFARNGVGERMRIDSNGNVGIGTSSPASLGRLVVSRSDASNSTVTDLSLQANRSFSTSNNGLALTATASNGTLGSHDFGAITFNEAPITNGGSAYVNMYVGGTSSAFGNATRFLQTYNDGSIVNYTSFWTNSTERMRITSTGNVGIGTSSPNQVLSLYSALASGSGVGTAIQIISDGSGGDNGFIGVNKGTGNGFTFGCENRDIIFQTGNTLPFNGTERGRFTSAGLFQFNSGYGSVATAYGCRAWVNFNGQGTVAIRASGNVSSITDLGTGVFRINFTNAMPDTNYSVTSGDEHYGLGWEDTYQTTSVVTRRTTSNFGYFDPGTVCVQVVR